jgi:Zn2+/Cd2+-exporting ATPase
MGSDNPHDRSRRGIVNTVGSFVRQLLADFTPARRAVNPVLLEAPVVDSESARFDVFLTPTSAEIERKFSLIIASASGVFLAAAFAVSRLDLPGSLHHLFVLLAFTIAAVPATSSVWESLMEKRVDIDTLMLVGAGLAALVGSPMEGALLLFLFALSGALEEYSIGRTHSALLELGRLVPEQAIVLTERGAERVALRRVEVGQRVLVRPGDTIPLDGVVVEGGCAVNESAITGESLTRDKVVGDQVFAGTLDVDGRLVVEVSKVASDTTLAKILQLVSEARQRQASVQRIIDRLGPTYSVIVVTVSVLFALILLVFTDLSTKDAMYRAIALLIVCSPCALVIATPVAYLSAIAAAARRGILVKGGEYLETLSRARSIVFDKTGTLTTGRTQLIRVVCGGPLSEDDVLRYAGALESSSSHPIANAINSAMDDRGLNALSVDGLENFPGRGIRGRVGGRNVAIGRADFVLKSADESVHESILTEFESIQDGGAAVVIITVDRVPSLLVFADTIRDNAANTIVALRELGIGHIELLTGDHERVAKFLTDELGIEHFRANLLPEEKLEVTRQLKNEHETVVMVGDGVNDAPALAACDVGIAIGSIGADVALEAADVVLMNDSIEGVPWILRHAKRTTAIVRQNLIIAIGVITVLAVFAMMGDIPLPLAVVGHEGSTVLVALNGLRLLKGSDRD